MQRPYQSALTEKLDAILAAARHSYEEAKKAEAEALCRIKEKC